MAVLKMTTELTEINPTLISVMNEYFDSVEEADRGSSPLVREFRVQKEGIPTSDINVYLRLETKEDVITINSVEVI